MAKLQGVICPIHNKQYYAVDRSLDVCGLHLRWKVSICPNCGRASFVRPNNTTGACFECEPDWMKEK